MTTRRVARLAMMVAVGLTCSLGLRVARGAKGTAAPRAQSSAGSTAAAGSATAAASAKPQQATPLEAVLDAILDRLRRASERRRPRPPVAVEVSYRARQIAALALGDEVLAIAAADVSPRPGDELVVLTARGLHLLGLAGDQGGVMRDLGSTQLTGDPPVIRPRDAVGSLAIDTRDGAPVVWLRSSEFAEAAGYSWGSGQWREIARRGGFPLCQGGSVSLVDGRNTFDGADVTWEDGAAPAAPFAPPALFYAGKCAQTIGPKGELLSLTGIVGADRVLRLRCRTRTDERSSGAVATAKSDCPLGQVFERDVPAVGVGFALGDINNDGHAEVVVSAASLRGEADKVTVYDHSTGRIKRTFTADLPRGVIDLTVGDFDGDGARDVVAVVRPSPRRANRMGQAAPERFTFWRLTE